MFFLSIFSNLMVYFSYIYSYSSFLEKSKFSSLAHCSLNGTSYVMLDGVCFSCDLLVAGCFLSVRVLMQMFAYVCLFSCVNIAQICS